ncbi:MAG: arylsulfotransferase family protein [Planctomycetota bacterium]
MRTAGRLLGAALALGAAFAVGRWSAGPTRAGANDTDAAAPLTAAASGNATATPPAGPGAGAAAALPAGRWHAVRNDAADHPNEDSDTLRELAQLPYAAGSNEAPERRSVTVLTDAADLGVNLVLSGHAPVAQLIDMKGAVLHEWRKSVHDVWPDYEIQHGFPEDHTTFFRRAHLLPNGDLLVVYEYIGLICLDKDSNVRWAYRGGCHHDLHVGEDGTIHTLAYRLRTEVPARLAGHPAFLQAPYFEDVVVELSASGEVRREISVLQAFVDSQYGSTLALLARQGDFFHPNTVSVMDGRFADRHPLYRQGNLLVCVRNSNTVGVIDPRTERVVWALQGLWTYPHDPSVVEAGRLLVFDNLGDTMQSRIVEVDPLTQEVTWTYRGSPKAPFLSEVCGASQRLPGGNTMIVETTGGRAFEVNRAGDIVWEYLNPHRAGEEGEFIASLFDCVRLDPSPYAAALPALADAGDRGPLPLDAVRALSESKK